MPVHVQGQADHWPCARLLQGRLFAGAGITKIRLTGGEPTLRKDIAELTAQLAAVPGIADVGITTNGIALARKLPDLQAAGAMHAVAVRLLPSR
jgi:molybdenum cofactor biosynthesis enzyme MoaA